MWSPTSRPPSTVAINDFLKSLVPGDHHHPCCAASSASACARVIVVALAIPLTLAIVFTVMNTDAHRPAARFTRCALIIALTLLVDDAMTTVDAMTAAAGKLGDCARTTRRRLPTARWPRRC